MAVKLIFPSLKWLRWDGKKQLETTSQFNANPRRARGRGTSKDYQQTIDFECRCEPNLIKKYFEVPHAKKAAW
jgi:hypothetical protein